MRSFNRPQNARFLTIVGSLALLGLLLLAGCMTTSVYPFYFAKQVIYEPKLVGRWTQEAEATNSFWSFQQDRTNQAYELRIVDGRKETKYWIHLFKLKQWVFLDGEGMTECEGIVSPHYLAKVVQFEPTLKLQLMDKDWIEDYLEDNPRALRHIKKPGQYDGHVVLTADTAELQKFILKHAANTNFFGEELNFLRRP